MCKLGELVTPREHAGELNINVNEYTRKIIYLGRNAGGRFIHNRLIRIEKTLSWGRSNRRRRRNLKHNDKTNSWMTSNDNLACKE